MTAPAIIPPSERIFCVGCSQPMTPEEIDAREVVKACGIPQLCDPCLQSTCDVCLALSGKCVSPDWCAEVNRSAR